jgi:hypothetical protein
MIPQQITDNAGYNLTVTWTAQTLEQLITTAIWGAYTFPDWIDACDLHIESSEVRWLDSNIPTAAVWVLQKAWDKVVLRGDIVKNIKLINTWTSAAISIRPWYTNWDNWNDAYSIWTVNAILQQQGLATEAKQDDTIAWLASIETNQTDKTQFTRLTDWTTDQVLNSDWHVIVDFDADHASHDWFWRLRVSNPKTLLDFKQTRDWLPLFFDDAETSWSWTSSTYQSNKASTRISVAANTAWVRVRQSKQWSNYQPWKSQLIFETFANSLSVSWIRKQAWMYWDNWGIYHKHEDWTANVWIRTYNTWSAVDNDIAQADWNYDKMDWTWRSWITLDFSKTQILIIDFEWLWVWRVRVWWVVDWCICYCHYFNHANNLDEVYMSNPNAPIRYEIENDWTWPADSFDTICSSIISEWWQDETALTSYHSRNWTSITLANQDLYTPLISLRLKSNGKCTRIWPQDLSVHLTSNDNFEWVLFLNPTIAGTDNASWSDVTNSSLQIDTSRTNANTLTWGFKIAWWYWSSSNQIKIAASWAVDSFLTIWSNIDWTSDELVLAVANIDWNWWTAYWWITVTEYC